MEIVPRFDLDLLHALAVIAEAGSLSAAAPRLCRSQSAVSEQVRKLEQACGLPLLSRGRAGASLTPAGERLLGHAREILALNDAAQRDMQGSRLAGALRLAMTDYFRPAAISAVLRRLRARYPHLHLRVSILKSARIEEECGQGAFDIGLSMRILDGAEEAEAEEDGRLPLRREPLRWVADAGFTLGETARIPLLVLPDTCSLQRLIVRALARHGAAYDIGLSTSGVGGLHLALAAGLGVTCLNASAVPPGARCIEAGGRLPTMPDVAFSLLPPRVGEAAFVTEARHMLAEQLA